MTTIEFTTSQNWTHSDALGSGSVTIKCWGAGGHGKSTGEGGSGGGFASSSLMLPNGIYPIVVGQATDTDGGLSSFTSASVIIVKAPGGKLDGTISHQAALLTGSVKYAGGAGTIDLTTYAQYDAAGGGSAAGENGAGVVGDTALFTIRERGAPGGAARTNGGAGGDGAYYYAGSGRNEVKLASDGGVPGGGGGGGYDYGTNSAGAGGGGKVIVIFEDDQVTPTPTVTSTVTPSPTITPTITPTPSVTATITPTITPTPSVTATGTPTPTPTPTPV